MPQGRLWEACFLKDSNLGLLIKTLAIEYYRLQLLIEKFSTETDIRQTIDLVEEWEKSVGIPNACFTVKGIEIETRRKQIEAVFSNFGGVQLAEDFERVGLFFDYTINCKPGSDITSGSYTDEEKTHMILIEITSGVSGDFFPFTFPFTFGVSGATFLQCIFDMLAPANVEVLIEIL